MCKDDECASESNSNETKTKPNSTNLKKELELEESDRGAIHPALAICYFVSCYSRLCLLSGWLPVPLD